jgi:hypothetical protein
MLRRGAAVLIAAMLGTVAHAQPSDKVGIERFHLAIDRAGMLDVEWAGVPPHLAWNAGVFVGFAHAPLVVYDRNMEPIDALVDRRLTTSLTGSIALFGRLQLGAALDVVGYQSGADVLATMESLPSGGVGDVRLLGKLMVAGTDRYQLALIPALTIPGGDAGGYLREAGITFSPAVAASVRFDALRIAGNVGYHVKPRVDSSGLVSDDEAFLRIAAGYELGAPRAPLAELWLASSIATPLVDAERNQVALEVLAGAAYRFTPMIDGFVAGGIGLDNGFGTPDWRALAGVRFGAALADRPLAAVTASTTPGLTPPTTTGPTAPVDAIAHVHGIVVDPDGRPLPGAKITIVQLDLPDASPVELVADGEGMFAVDLEPGALEITARVREFKDSVTQARAEAGGKTAVSVKLVRAVRQGQLRGQVLSFKGKPLAATIHVKGKTETSVTTDADGQFTIELPEGTFSVEIASPGHVMQKRNVTIKLDAVTVLNVDLRSGK